MADFDPEALAASQDNAFKQAFLTPEAARKLAEGIIGPDVAMQESEIARQRALADALRKPQEAHGPLGALAATLRGYQSSQKDKKAEELFSQLLGQDLGQRRNAASFQLGGYGQEPQADGTMAAPIPLADDQSGAAPGANVQQQLAQAAALRKPSQLGDYFPVMNDLGLGGGGY